MAQNPGIYMQGARIIVKYNLNGHALLTVYAKTDKLHKDSMTGLYFDLTFFHKYDIMQGVREEYSLAPFCVFLVIHVTKFWKITDWKNLETNYIFSKNSCQLHANALAKFFKFPRNIVYVYIDVCMYVF